jgi:hypothetical protein
MADYYVCKYASKYVSELVYAFKRLRDLQSKQELKVLAFGCGPCTDLLALDYLRDAGIYKYTSLEYRGVDYGKDIWRNVHQDLKNIAPMKTTAPIDCNLRFFYSDAIKLVDTIAAGKWTPNLVVFQYFFSDMTKNAESQEITDFIHTFAEYANRKMKDGSYVVVSEINLSTKFGGGREYFDRLLSRLRLDGDSYATGHFHNNNQRNTYGYGDEFSDNSLFFNTTSLSMYQPFESCSSAQMIYKKGGASI